jgi:hypothetical protein
MGRGLAGYCRDGDPSSFVIFFIFLEVEILRRRPVVHLKIAQENDSSIVDFYIFREREKWNAEPPSRQDRRGGFFI